MAPRSYTVIHELKGAPSWPALVTRFGGQGAGGGWAVGAHDLKSVLETGKPLTG